MTDTPADTNTLRPEVREAVDGADGWASGYLHRFLAKRYWETIRAELLRLAGENAQLRDVLADRDMDREMARQAKAELAALRARFAEAPFVSVRVDDDKHVSLGARSHPKDFAHLHCKHGRLVREDGDD